MASGTIRRSERSIAGRHSDSGRATLTFVPRRSFHRVYPTRCGHDGRAGPAPRAVGLDHDHREPQEPLSPRVDNGFAHDRHDLRGLLAAGPPPISSVHARTLPVPPQCGHASDRDRGPVRRRPRSASSVRVGGLSDSTAASNSSRGTFTTRIACRYRWRDSPAASAAALRGDLVSLPLLFGHVFIARPPRVVQLIDDGCPDDAPDRA
jgi:hypothetical protein